MEESYLILADIFWHKENKILGNKTSINEILKSSNKFIDKSWLKVARAIVTMKFKIPVSIMLNTGEHHANIGVNQIGEMIFSVFPKGDNFHIFSKNFKKFETVVANSSREEIKSELTKGLKNFLREITKKEGLYCHPKTKERLYFTTKCLDPKIIRRVS